MVTPSNALNINTNDTIMANNRDRSVTGFKPTPPSKHLLIVLREYKSHTHGLNFRKISALRSSSIFQKNGTNVLLSSAKTDFIVPRQAQVCPHSDLLVRSFKLVKAVRASVSRSQV